MFLAFFHELLGPIFEEQAFHDASPKVILEYSKKCDPDLQFQHYRGVNEQYNPTRFPSFNPTLRAVEILHCESISKQTDSGKWVASPTVKLNLYVTTTTSFIIVVIITIITLSTIHILTPTPHISHISLTPSSDRRHHIMNMHFKCCPLLFTHNTSPNSNTATATTTIAIYDINHHPDLDQQQKRQRQRPCKFCK